MRGGYTPAPLYYFLLAGIPHSAPQARGNTGRLSLRPAVGQAVPAALVSPLTPFPGISAVVLNLMLIYQPQAAQGGIFLARRSAARLKNQAAGRGATPLHARPAMPILFFAINRACRCNQGFCQGQGPFYPALTRRFQSARRICSICTAPGVSASCAGTCSAPCRS